MTVGLELPHVPVPLSRLVLGTMTFGDTADRATAAAMLDAALDAGITGVDTANGYAGGESERILAELLPGRRDRVVLATKAGIPHPDQGEHAPLSAEGLRAALEGSLKRLGTDHVDLFYLHQPDRSTPLAETLATVAEFVQDGKVLALGVSNFAAWQIAELNRVADEVGAPARSSPSSSTISSRAASRRSTSSTPPSPDCARWSTTLGGGLLTGRHSFEQAPEGGRFGDSKLAAMYRERYWNEDLFRAVTDLTRIASDAGLPLTELALRWLLSQPSTDALLLGGSKVDHLKANIAAASAGPLPKDVLAACDEVGARLRGPMPAYNR